MKILGSTAYIQEKSNITEYFVDISDIFHSANTSLAARKFNYIGFDPGTVNFGMAYLPCPPPDKPQRIARVFQIKLFRHITMPERIANVICLLDGIFFANPLGDDHICTIEGAAFGKQFRQIELAEQRATQAMWLMRRSCAILVPSIQTIRKVVFGAGKIKAQDAWKDILPKAPDGASALACALFGAFTYPN